MLFDIWVGGLIANAARPSKTVEDFGDDFTRSVAEPDLLVAFVEELMARREHATITTHGNETNSYEPTTFPR